MAATSLLPYSLIQHVDSEIRGEDVLRRTRKRHCPRRQQRAAKDVIDFNLDLDAVVADVDLGVLASRFSWHDDREPPRLKARAGVLQVLLDRARDLLARP